MSYATIETEEKDGTGFIYFNREEYLNTVTVEMVDEIMKALSNMEENCRSIVIGGRKNFSAGADIMQFSSIFDRAFIISSTISTVTVFKCSSLLK